MTTLNKTLAYSLIAALLAGSFLPTAADAGRRGGFSRRRSPGGSFRRSTSRHRSSTRRSTGRSLKRGLSRNRGASRRGGLIRTSPGRRNVVNRGRNTIKKGTPTNSRIGKGLRRRIRPANKGLRGRLLPNRRVTRNVRKYVRREHRGMFQKHHTRWSRWLGNKHRHKWGIGKFHHHHRFLWTWVIASTVQYYNPYSVDTGFFGGNDCYDYSEPVDGTSEPTDAGVEDVADANSAFTDGDYETALTEADAAIKEMPNNADLHQFRSLILFALGRYQESAAAAHAALVNDNGWDWDTLKSFYASTDTYTAQLRALEKYTDEKPKNAPGRFLLAYHYLMLGHAKAAVTQLKVVIALEPRDELAAGILAAVAKQEKIELEPRSAPQQGEQNPTPDNGGQNTAPLPPVRTPKNVTPKNVTPKKKKNAVSLPGTWTSQNAEGEPPVTLIFKADGTFSWTVTADKQKVVISGTYTLTGLQLKLNRKEGGALEGRITVKNSNQFVFKLKWQEE
ncbi:MAG: hypothetical protein ACE5KM_22465, partial [Planctomycetaceae bacterium]